MNTLHLVKPLFAIVAAACFGCGSFGPERFNVTGTATFNGQAIPRGSIVFTPDATQGNQGLQGRAEIRDGQVTTLRGEGGAGGPVLIEVQGFDGVPFQGAEFLHQEGQPLFSAVTTKLDLPRRDVQIRIAVTTTNGPPKLDVQLSGP